MERWKDVVGYEGFYQVSDQGRVKSLRRVVNDKGGERVIPERILRASLASRKYPSVCLARAKTKRTVCVHVLVAAAFIGERPLGHIVHHKDENKGNSMSDNLEYILSAEHTCHHNTGKRYERKLSFGDRQDIVARLGQGERQVALAAEYGVSQSRISAIKVRYTGPE